jgi:hypothetical protein
MGMTISVLYRGVRNAVAALAIAGTLAAPGVAQAQSTVYKCVDEQGRIEFTDTTRRGCKALDLPGLIPAPARRPAVPAPQQGTPAPRAPAATPAQGATPANFPRVDTSAQKVRDDDRRAILNDELRSEEKRLADLRRDFNSGEPERQGNERNYAKYQERVAQMRDDLNRTERNIEALRREIANLR